MADEETKEEENKEESYGTNGVGDANSAASAVQRQPVVNQVAVNAATRTTKQKENQNASINNVDDVQFESD